ncbi:calcium/sodium antiporter [Prochlorothrix hollandica]|uniref:calcium/sodium antiporter n=1 Tax=Prochlorothrix hollandica TaxID=1223 RepID=UPI0033411216
MSFASLIGLVVGLGLLVLGAEVLVKGASRLAAALGLSPLVIGLTIVAYGTSAPELAVSLQSVLNDEAAIAIGNVVGSNIFNVLFILGVSAIITPLVVAQQIIRLDVPIMIGISVLLLLMGLDGIVNRWEGLILVAGAVLYTVFLFTQGGAENDAAVQEEYNQEYALLEKLSIPAWVLNLTFVLAGIAILVVGSTLMVNGAIAIAEAFGVSRIIIGLTIVALGTSLPELATSVIASLHNERDIAVGNVVGSNIFNILAVVGLASVLSPHGLEIPASVLHFDLPVMIVVALACLPIFCTGNVISRWEGMVFLGYYGAYTTYLILKATQHDALPMFSSMVVWFAIPLTIVTLATVSLRAWRSGSRPVVSPNLSDPPDDQP